MQSLELAPTLLSSTATHPLILSSLLVSVGNSVADPDPPDPHVFGPPDPDLDPLVKGMDPDPDLSI